MTIHTKSWKRNAILDGKEIGILVLTREPKIGSKVFLPGIKNENHKRINVLVIEIDENFIKLKKAKHEN